MIRPPRWLVVLGTFATLPFLCGGCVREVGPVEFLARQLSQAPVGASEMGYQADYEGKRRGYHYMTLRAPTLFAGSVWHLLTGQIWVEDPLRCKADLLGDDYPKDMWSEAGAANISGRRPMGVVSSRRGEEYDLAVIAFIRRYLGSRGKLRAEDVEYLDKAEKRLAEDLARRGPAAWLDCLPKGPAGRMAAPEEMRSRTTASSTTPKAGGLWRG